MNRDAARGNQERRRKRRLFRAAGLVELREEAALDVERCDEVLYHPDSYWDTSAQTLRAMVLDGYALRKIIVGQQCFRIGRKRA